jgi:uncharacterized protein (TIGR03084 family)
VEKIIADLAAEHASLQATLAGLSDVDWARDSRCPGWSIADVVLHMAQSDELAWGSARGDIAAGAAQAGWDAVLLSNEGPLDVDVIADRAVAAARGLAPADLLARHTAAADGMRAALAACDPRAPLPWVVGRLPARTLATTRLAECWIHTGDICDPLGIKVEPTERLWHIARLAWRTIPYAFMKAGRELSGPVGLVLQSPAGGTWRFDPAEPAVTVVEGDGHAFCLLAARRLSPAESGLIATGPDADAVLELTRTFA